MAVCALADRLSRREQIFYGVERVDGVVAPEVIDIIDQLFPVVNANLLHYSVRQQQIEERDQRIPMIS